MRHPNPYKRLGAALSLNYMNTAIRTEDDIADMFILEILQNAIFCLKLCHSDEASIGTFATKQNNSNLSKRHYGRNFICCGTVISDCKGQGSTS